MQTKQDPQSNLEQKDSPIILKDYSSSRTVTSILTSIAPELSDWPNEIN